MLGRLCKLALAQHTPHTWYTFHPLASFFLKYMNVLPSTAFCWCCFLWLRLSLLMGCFPLRNLWPHERKPSINCSELAEGKIGFLILTSQTAFVELCHHLGIFAFVCFHCLFIRQPTTPKRDFVVPRISCWSLHGVHHVTASLADAVEAFRRLAVCPVPSSCHC